MTPLTDNTKWHKTKHRHTRRLHGHNYNGIGTYEVTVVVAERHPVFGRVESTNGKRPALVPTLLGKIAETTEIPKIHDVYPSAEVWQTAIMPDHIHMIIRINAPLPPGKHLGHIVGAFKGGVTRVWRRLMADAINTGAPTPAPGTPAAPPATGTPAALHAAPVSGASAHDSTPLFEPNYNDHILMRDGQLKNWKRYLRDNPYRLWIMQQRPHLMQRAQCMVIAGTRYAAFGNFLLLRHPEKHQVFFHRRTDGRPTEDTPLWTQEHNRLISLAEQGDVLVTPGISECEKRIKHEALDRGLRLIHIQGEPITAYWKPEGSRFEACCNGNLLILAPWQEDLFPAGNDSAAQGKHATFHRLNDIAAALCRITADTECSITR